MQLRVTAYIFLRDVQVQMTISTKTLTGSEITFLGSENSGQIKTGEKLGKKEAEALNKLRYIIFPLARIRFFLSPISASV